MVTSEFSRNYRTKIVPEVGVRELLFDLGSRPETDRVYPTPKAESGWVFDLHLRRGRPASIIEFVHANISPKLKNRAPKKT